MKFRIIDIPRLVFQLLRSNYAVQTGIALNNLYKYIVCCLYDIELFFRSYALTRTKAYMIASCAATRGQVVAVLNRLYGQYGEIYLGGEDFQDFYLYDEASATPDNTVYFYTEDTGNPVYLGFEGASANIFTILIPVQLKNDAAVYSDFIADLNAIIMYGLTYEIQTY